MTVWQWDPSLYLGSAAYYANGRMPYSPDVVRAIRSSLELDGTGRLLDVGCGPGSLTLPLAAGFEQTVAIDADPGMVEAGRSAAESRGIGSISWQQMRGEELPGGLGRFRVIAFAQSFHWMDPAVVVPAVAGMLEPGGTVVHVGATTDKGSGQNARTPLGYPQPPWAAIAELVGRHLGAERRAGQGLRPDKSWGRERELFAAGGFGEPRTVTVPDYIARVRTVDEVVAAVYSLSYSAPHLFGERREEFEAQLRDLLHAEAAAGGLFAEQTGSATLTFWPAPQVATDPEAVAGPTRTALDERTAAKPAAAKPAARKSTAKKPSARKAAVKKSPAKKATAKSATAKSATAKQAPAKKTPAKRTVVKKASAAAAAGQSVAENTGPARSAEPAAPPKQRRRTPKSAPVTGS